MSSIANSETITVLRYEFESCVRFLVKVTDHVGRLASASFFESGDVMYHPEPAVIVGLAEPVC
jgi:hypothetical protein